MEELLQLRDHLEHQRYAEALELLGEMEEMSREDKISKIRSFARILLLHLIKQAAEKRTTRSWNLSIRNATEEIITINQRHKARGTYLNRDDLARLLTKAYPLALARASVEAFEGQYSEEALGAMVDQAAIEAQALRLVTTE